MVWCKSFPLKVPCSRIRALGYSQEQEAARVKGILEVVANLLLEFSVEIDKEVAARDHIQTREGRIPQQAIACEQYDMA
jgi:hypothetical protein